MTRSQLLLDSLFYPNITIKYLQTVQPFTIVVTAILRSEGGLRAVTTDGPPIDKHARDPLFFFSSITFAANELFSTEHHLFRAHHVRRNCLAGD